MYSDKIILPPTKAVLDELNSIQDLTLDFHKYAFPVPQLSRFYKVVSKNMGPSHHRRPTGRHYNYTTRDYEHGPYMPEFVYSEPKADGSPGDWAPVHVDPKMCYHGIHVTNNPIKWMSANRGTNEENYRLFLVEARGIPDPFEWGKPHDELPQDHKYIASTVRLTKEIDLTDDKQWDEHVIQIAKIQTIAKDEIYELQAKRQREQMEKLREAAITEAAEDGKIFVDSSKHDAQDFVVSVLNNFNCPQCGAEDWSIEKREEVQETVHSTRILTLNSNGTTDEETNHEDGWYNDSEVIETTLHYNCCDGQLYDDDLDDKFFFFDQDWEEIARGVLEDY